MKHKYLKLLYSASSLIWTGFIFNNSLKTASESGEMSGGFLDFLNGTINKILPDLYISELFIRKAAHFTEFFVLGLLLSLTFLANNSNKIKLIPSLFSALAALSVAAADELLQLFSPGRSCQFTDVLIDFAGASTGIIIVYFFLMLFHRKRKNKSF